MRRLFFLLVFGLTALSVRAETPVILVFGDSISAGYGLAHIDQGWVGMLRMKLKDEGYGYEVINASVTGETTAGGLARLPHALSVHHPRIVIIELGGNDGLRALPIDQMRANLATMVDLSVSAGARVLLLGIRIPPNYGPEFTEKFRAVFPAVAEEKKIPLVPFLLADIALSPDLMQADGMHPNELGQPILLANVWPSLKAMLHSNPPAGKVPSPRARTLGHSS
ncbi:MAG: arylesterase [Pseudomonadota bacterium]|nr:arylesterase [Pseudomonadota bacterium]